MLIEGAVGDTHALTMELQLSRYVMRMCTCGAGPRPSDLTFLLAFKGADCSFKYEVAAVTNLSRAPSHGSVWGDTLCLWEEEKEGGAERLKGQ